MDRSELTVMVRTLLWEQLFGVLATQGSSGLHTSIVSFAAADDLHAIVFATPRATRKYRNLAESGSVSFFVDDRENDASSIGEIHGMEARGVARELSGDERGRYESLYAARHPQLAEFARNSALMCIDVERYDIVHRFQDVYVLEMEGPRPVDSRERNG